MAGRSGVTSLARPERFIPLTLNNSNIFYIKEHDVTFLSVYGHVYGVGRLCKASTPEAPSINHSINIS